MRNELVSPFSAGRAEDKELLGGKGANLAEMTRLGLPVPSGFTITTVACKQYYQEGKQLWPELLQQMEQAIGELENRTGKKFGSTDNPLLVSVRSGAPVSMPGMMDTILNLGLNDTTVDALAKATANPRFALDCYRRFIQMFGGVVLGIPHHDFEAALSKLKDQAGVRLDTDLDEQHLATLVETYKDIVVKATRNPFPQQPVEQLKMAVKAVFDSWNNNRAVVYRRINKIPEHYGTAVNVQEMVFGNCGDDSATGVLFTRNPSTGENKLYGEFLVNAQGEDVVAGIRTPQPIARLEELMPASWEELNRICKQLEAHYKEMQDIEFTIEKGKLFILQTRTGKRTARAAVNIAVDMVAEGLIDKKEAVLRIDAGQLGGLLHRQVSPDAKLEVIATGLPASPGAGCGIIVFDSDEAEALGKEGKQVILLRPETTPDDIHGIVEAVGILTSRGGMTSHAAVVARGMGKPCVCGCEAIKIDLKAETAQVGNVVLKKGDVISIDGGSGRVILGQVPLVEPELSDEFNTILQWADEFRELGIRANADTPQDALRAREFGAEGIGLCRTEHMFMAADRLPIVQSMILAEDTEGREAALAQLLPIQQQDFYGIFKAMEGLPVTVRLLDPPLHEFLPSAEKLAVDVALLEAGIGDVSKLDATRALLRQVRNLQEANPMLGNRGCRLGLMYPEIYQMQVEAILNAAAQLLAEGIDVKAEIMIPLVSHVNELESMQELVASTRERVAAETGKNLDILIGTMIELPRACVTADEIAGHADFFSFGTNDLTQTAFGFSRDDAEGKFLPAYLAEKLLPDNPFAVLDRKGVGKLMEIAVGLGRGKNSKLKIGICGEHGGEPSSIAFCHSLKMNYVSCSPYRVPVARLAAAQAALQQKA
ncbi:MAG: pyruvate, phosphate dikinase [Bacillota bacterium]|jgi:pyruvate,orthophosphate dikinase|nr:pyruvate, phosphate dikinase [Bacillota bacterium]HOC06371.1 pyruvate, phosphate dikinase [Bacillota bacterium]HPZ21786.1 pyruvate, phosphate dikinase [Bacillota bacterium]HQD19168.1 pyruvate, phosphate dikinase [Bacillota bacterium]